jgi:hypothetical protein
MPTVPPVLTPPATVLVSVVEVAGVGVIPWPAKTEDFHDPHIFILSLFPGNHLSGEMHYSTSDKKSTGQQDSSRKTQTGLAIYLQLPQVARSIRYVALITHVSGC